MIAFGSLTVVAAALVVFVARFFRSYDCHGENADCETESLSQLVIAYAGLIPAVGTLVASIRGQGHPWLWFLATVGVYAAWALLIAEWNN
jgi:hypothetical protein